MKSVHHYFQIAAGIVVAILLVTGRARAVPVAGHFVDDPRGDASPNQLLTHELGDVAIFPAAEAISYHDHRYITVGVPDDGIANDWIVHMTNASGQAWKNLFFVADNGATIGNADGTIEDVLGAAGVFNDAFRIRGALSGGVNLNLVSENMTQDEIFEPGEEWEFAITNFGTGLNSFAPTISTPGVFSGSAGPIVIGGNNGSILATPAPEPGTAAIVGVLGALALLRRPGRVCVPYL